MSEINIIDTVVQPELPEVLGVQSVYVTVPLATSEYAGIVQPVSSQFNVVSGVLELKSDIMNAFTDVSILSSRMGTAEGDISTLYNTTSLLSSRVGQNENDITSIYGRVLIAESKIDGLVSSVVSIPIIYATKSLAGRYINVNIDSSYMMTINLLNDSGSVISQSTVDLPLEDMVVSGSYSNQNIVLYLQNGNSITIPVGDLVNGLQTQITSSNKLNADLVDDDTAQNKFVNTMILSEIVSNTAARHTHANKSLLDTYTVSNVNIVDAVSKAHTHANKALLDTYDIPNASLHSAVSDMHSHSNKAQLDAITQSDINNLSALQSIIDGGGIGGGNGTYDYLSLINKPIEDSTNPMVSIGVLLENALIKGPDNISIQYEPVQLSATKMYLNTFSTVSIPSVFGSQLSYVSGKSIYNAYDALYNAALEGALEPTGDPFKLDISDLSNQFDMGDGNSLGFITQAKLTDRYVCLINIGTIISDGGVSSIMNNIMYAENQYSLTGFTSEEIMSWLGSIIDASAVYEYMTDISSTTIFNYSWYGGSYGLSEEGMFYKLSFNGGVLTDIYQPSFISKNFVGSYNFLSQGEISKVYKTSSGQMSTSPLAAMKDLATCMRVVDIEPTAPNEDGYIIANLSSAPSSKYSGYIYIYD